MIAHKSMHGMMSQRMGRSPVPAPSAGPRGFYEITSATLTSDLESLTRTSGADFVIIGMLMPASEGLTICDSLRQRGLSNSTVLMLRNVKDSAPGEDAGEDADDASTLHAGPVDITPGRHEVIANGVPVALTRTEFRLLEVMARKPGWVFSREKLMTMLHGAQNGCTERTIDVHMTSLRRKLGRAAAALETVRGIGYRFNA